MDFPKATLEHEWLKKLVGTWTFESGEGENVWRGTEVVRCLGDVWVVCEGKGPLPDGSEATSIMTLGFDPQRGRFVGTWVGSMMNYLWHYDGELDGAKRILSLNSEGPSFRGEPGLSQYRDKIEFHDRDTRTLTAEVYDPERGWTPFMRTDYRRS